MKKVIKASGLEEKFSPRKIYYSILEAGGSKKLANRAISEVKNKFRKKITTEEILKIILKVLKKEPGISERYNLKRAIMSLGPSGFPFEQFFGDLLREYGYKTKVGNYLKGKKIIHEVDIIAEKDKKYMIECKYHNQPGKATKLHPALYTYARFLDINSHKKVDEPWLVTNTKCSKDAKDYAKGVGLKITSWNYPQNESLKKLIEKKKLYPITILSLLDEKTKHSLFYEKIVLAKNILNYSILDLREKTGLSEKKVNKILEEVREVLK